MKNNDPETRLRNLELQLSDLDSVEFQAALRKELSFRYAIESALPSGITVIDDSGKQVYVNESFCKMFGWDEEELIGKRPPFIYWDPQDAENINRAFNQILNNRVSEEGFDLIFRHKTGRSVYVHVIVAPFTQESKKAFFLLNVIDITERKKTEDELRRSKLLLISSIESQKDTIIFSIDNRYNYLYFNKAHWESMKFAYNKDVRTGMNILECITSIDDRKVAKENYDRALSGESFSIIQSFGDANKAYYESYFNPVHDEKSEIIGCTGLARNITERMEANLALKESETKFREIINQINDALIVFDEQGKIIIWNKGAEQVCGLKASDILNGSISDLQYQFTPPPQKDKDEIENAIKGIITMQTPEVFNQIVESEMITIDSSNIKNIQSRVFPIKLNGYNLFCTVIRDTTEVKRYEKELLRISTDKDKFYSIIAQYLYNPINLFQDFTKTMVEEIDTLSIKEIQKMISMMSKSAANLYSLLDNMLQWTKIHQGKITYSPQKLDFLKISREAVSILKPNAEAKNIKINHFIEEGVTVYGDLFMLKTVMRNLVANAIEFTANRGHIDISASKTDSDVTISVLASATDIDADYLSRQFSLAAIHSSLGQKEEKGTTLGLLLCKEYIEKHGGKIWVADENEQGSEVKFTLSDSL